MRKIYGVIMLNIYYAYLLSLNICLSIQNFIVLFHFIFVSFFIIKIILLYLVYFIIIIITINLYL